MSRVLKETKRIFEDILVFPRGGEFLFMRFVEESRIFPRFVVRIARIFRGFVQEPRIFRGFVQHWKNNRGFHGDFLSIGKFVETVSDHGGYSASQGA